jgi:insertion element IS1 protein InsB
VFSKHQDEGFQTLKTRLEPYNIVRDYTEDWGTSQRHLGSDTHKVGKRNTQKIECKNLNVRTGIKRLNRKTICFSKLQLLHDTVIGLLINKVEFGLDIHA